MEGSGAGCKEADRRSPILTLPKKMCVINVSSKKAEPMKKTVTFNDERLEELIEFEDDDESKAGRKCYWEFMAVDRFRFRNRIANLESLLSPILEKSHRNMVYLRTRESSVTASMSAEVVQLKSVIVTVTCGGGKP